jgi:uncharacterized protein YjiS (DUF1127 family)
MIMALVLSGERPAAAAITLNPFVVAAVWVAKLRAGRNQRLALNSLLALDADRLSDLGINRGDLFDALKTERHPTRLLAERRERRFHY